MRGKVSSKSDVWGSSLKETWRLLFLIADSAIRRIPFEMRGLR